MIGGLYVLHKIELKKCIFCRYTSPDFLYVRSWLPCIFFAGGITMGNIGRQLAMVSLEGRIDCLLVVDIIHMSLFSSEIPISYLN